MNSDPNRQLKNPAASNGECACRDFWNRHIITSLRQYGNGFAIKERRVSRMLTYLASIFLDLAISCTIIPHHYPEPNALSLELSALSFDLSSITHEL